jgi:hypothetical protein
MRAAAALDRLPALSAWLENLPEKWRSENAVILAALALSAVFLIAFCVVVSGVVRSAEQQHQQAGQAVVAEPVDQSS